MSNKYPTLRRTSAFALLVLAGTSCVPADRGVDDGATGAALDTGPAAGSESAPPPPGTGGSWMAEVQARIRDASHADEVGAGHGARG